MKDTLNEIKSLMRRMEETPNGGSNYLTESINEVTCKWRDVVGEENFYDLLAGLKPGNRVTFGYVSAAKIEVPKVGRSKSYETLGKNLGVEGTLTNVIKLTIYNLPWQKQGPDKDKYPEGNKKFYDTTKGWKDQDSFEEKYNAWKDLRNKLYGDFNIESSKPKYQTDTNNFGDKGGVKQYAGNNQELTAHTYTRLNMHNVKPISTTYYLVMSDGHIKPIDIEKLTLLPYKASQNEIDKLKAAGATEKDVEPLIGMVFRQFEHSHVLFVSATPDTGVPTLLINNKLSDKIGGVTGVNVHDIIRLAQERYAKFMNTDVKFIQD